MKAFFASSTGWLRIASVLTLLLCLGHSIGYPWTPDHTPVGLAAAEQMKAFHIDAMGFERSYFDFYVGFGITCSITNLALTLVLWQLGTLAKAHAAMLRPMIATLLVAFAGYAVIDCLYFFTAPIVLAIPTALCLVPALALAGRKA